MSNTEYGNYLKSKHWNDIKKQTYSRSKTCVLCGYTRKKYGSKINLNIHHSKYKKHGESVLYKETPNILFVMCEICHEAWHKHKPKNVKVMKNKYVERIRLLIKNKGLSPVQAIMNCSKKESGGLLDGSLNLETIEKNNELKENLKELKSKKLKTKRLVIRTSIVDRRFAL